MGEYTYEYVAELIEKLPSYWKKIYANLLEEGEKHGIKKEELFAKLVAIFNSIAEDVIPDEIERLSYAIKNLKIKLAQQIARPTTTVTFIPLGVSPLSFSRNKRTITVNIPALVVREVGKKQRLELVLIKLYDKAVALADEIEPFYYYKAKAIEFRNIYIINDLIDVKRIETEKLVSEPEKQLEFLKKHFQTFKIREGRKYASSKIKIGNREIVDPLDLRIAEGVFVNRAMIKQSVIKIADDETSPPIERGLYIVSDESVPLEDELDEEGYPVPKVMYVWVNKRLLRYGSESEITVIGTLNYTLREPKVDEFEEENELDKATEKVPIAVLSMNAYWVFPGRFVNIIK